MTAISIFYQGEGIREIAHFEADPASTFADIKQALIQKHGLSNEALLFLEDGEEPVDDKHPARDHVGRAGIKLHVHRCRQVVVSVAFNGETVEHRFAPGATIARVKKWAAERKFGMTPQEASEHVLQIAGTKDRPDPGTHIGRLASCPDCRIKFDLVPNERINGAWMAPEVAA